MLTRMGDTVNVGAGHARHSAPASRAVHSVHAQPGRSQFAAATHATGVPARTQCAPFTRHGTVICARASRRTILKGAGELP